MKKVLIISPHFPPVNTADMQRVRQSLPYFRELGWEPTIITVDENYVEAYSLDPLLLKTFPQDIRIYKVAALKPSVTRKLGIGSLSMRAYFHIKQKGDEVLKAERFDLVFFSTTAFHVMALGPGWKKKFGVPFILDIQDPWFNTFYFAKALHKRGLKERIFHKIDQYLENKTLPFVDGIISVSPGYRDLYMKRYAGVPYDRFCIIPFGCATLDFQIVKDHIHSSRVSFSDEEVNVVYIGRGGHDMELAIDIIFDALNIGLKQEPELFKKLRLWFIGTSYAQAGKGVKTIEPIAARKGVAAQVTEITDRIPHFEALYLLSKADVLCVPGSTDPTYTASKIYPYIYINRPMLAVFHEKSSVVDVLRATGKAKLVTFGSSINEQEKQHLAAECFDYLLRVLNKTVPDSGLNYKAFEQYTARSMAVKQMGFFDRVIKENASAAMPGPC